MKKYDNYIRMMVLGLIPYSLILSLFLSSCQKTVNELSVQEEQESKSKIVCPAGKHNLILYNNQGQLEAVTEESSLQLPVYIDPAVVISLLNRLPKYELQEVVKLHMARNHQPEYVYIGNAFYQEDKENTEMQEYKKLKTVNYINRISKRKRDESMQENKERPHYFKKKYCVDEDLDKNSCVILFSANKKLGIQDLPVEVLEQIICCLSYKKLMLIRQLSHLFYALATGYDKVGVVGIEEKPQRRINMFAGTFKHIIDLNKLEDKLATIPSFVFYRLMGSVKHVPQLYWPYLAETQIHTINFWKNNIGPKEAELLGNCLQKSKIHTVYLWYNQIGNAGAEVFLKNLEGLNLQEVDLRKNEITDKGLGKVAKYAKMLKLNLSNNTISSKGITKFAKKLSKSPLRIISLENNKICDEGAKQFVTHLKGSDVQTIYLSSNDISSKGAVALAKRISRTKIEEIGLTCNYLENEGAIKFIKKLQGTKVHKVDLSYNYITDEGAKSLADNLKNTQIHTIDLRQSKPITELTQKLLREQHPYLNWIF